MLGLNAATVTFSSYRWIAFLGLFLLTISCEQGAMSKGDFKESIPEGPRVGFRAPHFSAPSLQGNSLTLSDYKGKVLMINFWATWCVPCRVEMPSMEQLYDKFGGNEFEILAISGGESQKVVWPFVEDLKLSFPILLDEQFQIHGQYQVTAIPSTYLVDKSGVITHRFFGAVDWTDEHYRQLVAKLIKSKT